MKIAIAIKSNRIYIVLLVVFILVLPYAKINLGPLPIYFVDILVGFLLIKKAPYSLKLSRVDVMVFVFWVLSVFLTIVEILTYGYFLDSTYMFIRFSFSMAPLFLLTRLVRDEDDFRLLMSAVVFGLLINSILSVCYTFSFTRNFVDFIFQQEILYPTRSRLEDVWDSDLNERGRTLAGNPNSTAFILFTGIIVGITYLRILKKRPKWAILALTLGVLGALLTMSRSAYLTMFLLLTYLLIQRHSRYYFKYITVGCLCLITVVFMTGYDLDNLNVSRLVDAVDMATGDSELGYGEEARIHSWTAPFDWMIESPSFIVHGFGMAAGKIRRRGQVNVFEGFNFIGGEVHSVFASLTFERGFLSFLVFLVLILYLYKKVFLDARYVAFEKAFVFREMSRMLMLNLLFPLLLAHYLTDNEIGSYQLFFTLALVLKSLDFYRANNSSLSPLG